jgi:hypothetical protein
MLNDITFDLPNGTKNLTPLFPSLDWRLIAEYYLELIDDQGATVCTTPVNKVTSEWSYPKIIRVHFLNYLGRYDSVTFQRYTKSDEVKSETWLKPLPVNATKTDTGLSRSNVRASDIYSCKTWAYTENAQKWLEELLESPLAFIEWSGIEGQTDDFLPIVIKDKTMATLKEEERYVYEVAIDFVISNEKIGLRI